MSARADNAATEVVLYTTGWCPFCIRAKHLLDQRGIVYTEHRVDLQPSLRDEMTSRAAGRTSVPQVFIGDTHVGGCDELHALDARGGLGALAASRAP